MYISATQTKSEVVVWERNAAGRRITKHYPIPYNFYYDDPYGEHLTIFGTRVSYVEATSSTQFKQLCTQHAKNGDLWESDISPVLKVLSTHYYEAPIPSLKVGVFDIEVDYDPSLGITVQEMVASNPYAIINSIALGRLDNKELVLITIPAPTTQSDQAHQTISHAIHNHPVVDGYSTRIIVCEDEAELLLTFLREIQDIDLLSGWNSNNFDITYLARRIIRVLDKTDVNLDTHVVYDELKNTNKLSYVCDPNKELHTDKFKFLRMLDFPKYGKVSFKPITDKESNRLLGHTLTLTGRVHLDYMDLVKKYDPGEKRSYKLADIADSVIVNSDGQPTLPKLEYDGTLSSLYRDDYAWFSRYNIRDVEILVKFEEILGYIQVANLNCHLSTALFSNVFGTLKLAECALINLCHYKRNRVVPNVSQPEVDEPISGALVLFPQIGEHQYIASIDINSLYPSAIRSINISPETLFGQCIDNVLGFERISKKSKELVSVKMLGFRNEPDIITKTGEEWYDYLNARQIAISGYGTLFSQQEQGIIPELLESWYNSRKEYQTKKKQAISSGESSKDNAASFEQYSMEAEYYDRLQYVFKIKLNSLYGALTNLYFRFYNKLMGESTTGTGREILRHQCRKVSEILTNKYDVDFPLYENVDDAMERGYTEREAIGVSLHSTKFNGVHDAKAVLYGDSVVGSTLISRADGTNIPIETLFRRVTATHGNKEYFMSDDLPEVNCIDPISGQYQARKVRYVMRHLCTKPLYLVQTNTRSVIVTEDHSVMVTSTITAFKEAKPTSLSNIHTTAVLTNDSKSYQYENIVSIRPYYTNGPIYVYDIEVDEFHTFFGNGILLHNTDSTYFETYAENNEDAIRIGNEVARQVNASYQEFMQRTFLVNPGYDDIIKCAREIISDRGIFVDKKRYFLHLIDLDGKRVDKIKIMGLDTKKTTLPQYISDTINKWIERYLLGTSWDDIAREIVQYKAEITNTGDLIRLGMPKGIKKIEQYTTSYEIDPNTRLPGHVAASILYNQTIERLNLRGEYDPIVTGTKILVFDLRIPHKRFKSVAIPSSITTLPQWFLDEFVIDVDKMVTKLIDNPLNNIIKSTNRQSPTEQHIALMDFQQISAIEF